MRSLLRDSSVVFTALALAHVTAAVPAAAQDARAANQQERLNRWRDLRFGLFLHWGPYSTLGGEWKGKTHPGNTEWIMRSAKIQRQDYRAAAEDFDPEGYDPDALVAFAKKSGFKYVVMTAKHYDGFALFDSKVSDFDAVDVLPSKRDLLKEFSVACQNAGMPLGYSYAVDRDWYHPGGNTLGEVWDPSQKGTREVYLQRVALPQLRELVEGYGPVMSLLADAGPGIPEWMVDSFQKAVGPDVVMPRDFAGDSDYLYTDSGSASHTISQVDWERCRCLGNSWGYRKKGMGYQGSAAIIRDLVSTASTGGNYLLNVGLDGDGRIPPEAASRLSEVGEWLARYGESVHGTVKSPFVDHPWKGVATLRDEGEDGATLYLHLFGKERQGKVVLASMVTAPESAEVMGGAVKPAVSGRPGRWEVDLSEVEPRDDVTVVKVKLPAMPEIGPGPVVAAADGSFQLSPGRATYPDRRTKLGRTRSSSNLQVTSFTDEKEAGVWDLHADGAIPVRLRMRSAIPAQLEDKVVLVQVNDAPPVEARAVEGSATEAPLIESPEFLLPQGSCRIRISGAPPGEAPVVSVSTSQIELLPTK